MKNLLKSFSVVFALCSLSFLTGSFKTDAKTTVTSDDSQSETEFVDLEEADFISLVNSVPLDDKSAGLIRKFQDAEARNELYNKAYNAKNGCKVETYRNKEVILITIPAAQLFAPNDTVLRPTAAALLNPIKRYLKEPDFFRVLLVMHTDNTGSPEYRDMLTEQRSRAVFEWFENQSGLDTEFLYPFAFGDDMPLVENGVEVENNTMSNREKNRRLEIYLVPGKKMLEQAKKGKISY